MSSNQDSKLNFLDKVIFVTLKMCATKGNINAHFNNSFDSYTAVILESSLKNSALVLHMFSSVGDNNILCKYFVGRLPWSPP